jgi:hypothetical protein
MLSRMTGGTRNVLRPTDHATRAADRIRAGQPPAEWFDPDNPPSHPPHLEHPGRHRLDPVDDQRPQPGGRRPEPEPGRRPRPAAEHRPEPQDDDPDAPVFHDPRGRRRRLVTLAFAAAAVVVVLALATLALALSGMSPVPVPGFPDATRNAGGPNGNHPPASTGSAGTARTTPDRTASTQPSATSTAATPTGTPSATSTHGRRPSQAPHPTPSKSK